jgi:hypothetical protein
MAAKPKRFKLSPEAAAKAAAPKAAWKKKVDKANESKRGAADRTIEAKRPEETAHVMELLAEGGRIATIAEAADMPQAVVKALMARLRRKYMPVQQELKRLKTGEMVAAIEDKIAMALHYMDDFVMAGSSASQLAVITGILVDKRQLLLGEPTQILSVGERAKLGEIMPLLLAEAKRRGQEIELRPDGEGNFTAAGLTPIPYEKDTRMGGFRDKRNTTPER